MTTQICVTRSTRQERRIFAERMLQHLLSTIAGRILTSQNQDVTND